MSALDRSRRSYSTFPSGAAVLASLTLVGALLSGCGSDSDGVPVVVPGSDLGGAGIEEPTAGPKVSGESPSAQVSTPDPDMVEKLKVAKKAKERESKDPNHFTACLKPDGTLAGEIEHARGADAAPLTEENKKKVCEKQSRFDNPADNPASRQTAGTP